MSDIAVLHGSQLARLGSPFTIAEYHNDNQWNFLIRRSYQAGCASGGFASSNRENSGDHNKAPPPPPREACPCLLR